MEENLVKSRAVGALVGLAVGDALGTTLEFQHRDSYEHLTDMVGGGPFRLHPGQWTDDTSLALCIADSIVEKRALDLHDHLLKFIKWRQEGYMSSTGRAFDIGNQTQEALYNYAYYGAVPTVDETSSKSGNGSLMRLAPVPMAFYKNAELAAKASGASSLTTHNSIECVEACNLYGRMIAEAIQGTTKEELLAINRSVATNYSSQLLREVLEGEFLNKGRDEICSSGYVVHTLEAALWAFYNSETFKEGALLAVNLGHDADTVGAVYGELAGAYYDLSGIPSKWVETLYWVDRIIEMGEGVYDLGGEIPVSAM